MPVSDSSAGSPHVRWDTVAILGVGLIGGSIGIDLIHRGLARRVVGIGRREDSLAVAREVGACNETTTELAQGVAAAQLVVVCTPVGRIVDDVQQVARFCQPDTLITDVGSTKARIVAQLDRVLQRETRFVGSHPLAGGEKAGPRAAVARLFAGRTVVVTPGQATHETDCAGVERFWQALGAKVTRMSPDEHDRQVAAASHLPHVVAAALAATSPDDCLSLTAGGWLDTTRIAAGDPALWKDILLSNRENVLAALVRYEECLGHIRAALDASDAAKLTEVLEEAKRKRDALGS